MNKPTLLISNYHLDFTGGGTYVMMILNVLKKYYTLYTDKDDIGYYYHESTPFRFSMLDKIEQAHPNQTFDVHLLAHYRGWISPRGKTNAQILYYPIDKKMDGWDNLFVLNEFCDKAASIFPGKKHIITPYYDASNFCIGEKTVDLINIGNYFIEGDGHSKNQHLFIEWFKTQPQFNKLIFHGTICNLQYYEYLRHLASTEPRIEINHSAPRSQILRDLSASKYLVHGIGYGRTNPAETEHFGLVALEALLCGCQPIVHKSGGCPDIPGVQSYTNFNEMIFRNTDPIQLRNYGMMFNQQNTELELKKALNL
jgi:glycosyltransferase involved in cell wall biosynthesis